MKFIYTFLFSSLLICVTACKDQEAVTPDNELPCRTLTAPLALNAETLKNELNENGLSIKSSQLKLIKAKDMYNAARISLLPSLNVGLLAQTVASPTFLISSVEVLLPFLLPEKWLQADQNKYLYKAEQAANEILKLNQLASLLSLVYSTQNDSKIDILVNSEIQQALTMERQVADLVSIGQALPSDFEAAQVITIMSQSKRSSIERLMNQEYEAIKFALNLCPSSQITLNLQILAPVDLESLTSQQAYGMMASNNLEIQQTDYFIQASVSEKWSKIYSLISGLSLSGKTSDHPFSALKPTARVGIGPGWIFAFSVSNDNIAQLKAQREEIKAELIKNIENTLSGMLKLQNQIDLSRRAIYLSERVLKTELEQYNLKEVTLKQVQDRATQLRNLEGEVMKLENELNLGRVVLKRMEQDL